MFEIIKEVIVKWDPFGLMEFAPSDEYDDECSMILDEFSKKKEPLGTIIYKVFKDNFGDTFQADLENCLEVATRIESRISKS